MSFLINPYAFSGLAYPYSLPIINPGAELPGGEGWTVFLGTMTRTATSGDGTLPHSGDFYHYGGTASYSASFQNVLIPPEMYADVDAGLLRLDTSFWAAGVDSDTSRVIFGFASDTNLASNTADLGTVTQALVNFSTWTEVTHSDPIPAGTRRIWMGWEADRNAGTSNDGYVDDIAATIVNPFFGLTELQALQQIFSGGEIGDYWRFDATNTDAAALDDEVTEAIGLVNGLALTDADPVNTPNLKLRNGAESILFDGAGDRLRHIFALAATQPGTMIIALDNSDISTHVILTGSSGTSRWQISNDSADNIIALSNSTILDSLINAPVGAKVLTAEFNGASSRFRSNGVTTATGDTGTGGTSQLTLGALWDGTFGGNFYSWSVFFIDRLLTTSERAYVEKLMAADGGIVF